MARRDAGAPVAVVGTGVVGLATAIGLARAGYRVRVFGDRPEPYARDKKYDLRVFAVNHASRAFLNDLGVWANIVAERVFAYSAMSVWSGDGRIDFDASDLGCGDDLGYIVENRLMRAMLFDRVSAMGDRVELRCPAMVDGIERAGDGLKIVTDDESDVVSAVIGADGANSRVRHLMRMRTTYTDYNQSAIVATLSVPPQEGGYCRQRFFDEGVLAFLPLDATTVSIVWSCRAATATELLALTEKAFARRVAQAFAIDAEGAECVELLSKRVTFPIRSVVAQPRIARGVALVGDAAHTVHPMAGLGANSGLADARALCRSATTRHTIDASVFRAYTAEATSRGLELRVLLNALNALFASRAPTVAALREAGLNGVNRARCLKAWFARRAAYLSASD